MTQQRINAENLMTFGCLFRVCAKQMRRHDLSIKQGCALMRTTLHRVAETVEIPGDVYRALVALERIDTTPATFADLLEADGDKAIAEAEQMKQDE